MMDLALNGKRLLSVLVEYSVSMKLSDDRFILIESPFTLDLGETRIALTPDSDSDDAFAPVRHLVGDTVAEAYADDDGTLSVAFDSGVRIRVEPDPHYEAWNVSGPDGSLVVCAPGGELAVWSAKPGGDGKGPGG